MLHGCGYQLSRFLLALAFISGFLFSSHSLAQALAQPSIGDRLVKVQMNDGSIQSIKLRDALLNQGVPHSALNETILFYDQNKSSLANQNYFTIIDFAQHSSQKRMYVCNLNTGKVLKHLVAHGKGSDTDHDGYADTFSNAHRSHASSLGFYLVAETYFGKHGYSVRMDGLSDTNSNARDRAVVIHGADYVKEGLPKMGRSLGCPALEKKHTVDVVDRIKEGSLLYITVEQ